MAYIKVNHAEFEKAAQSIDSYIQNHISNMRRINGEIQSLSTYWNGEDYAQFCIEWNYINAKDSTSGKMISALDNYAKYLRFCGNAYKSAQSRAINRANGLPR